MTDEELIRLYQARDPRAVEETKTRYGAYCATIARRLLTDARDVEECLSDCAMAVWNAIPPACPEHFKGWLGAIVRNRALAIGRENGRRRLRWRRPLWSWLHACRKEIPPMGSWRPESWGRPFPGSRSRRCAPSFSAATGMPTVWSRRLPIWAGASARQRRCSFARGTSCGSF